MNTSSSNQYDPSTYNAGFQDPKLVNQYYDQAQNQRISDLGNTLNNNNQAYNINADQMKNQYGIDTRQAIDDETKNGTGRD